MSSQLERLNRDARDGGTNHRKYVFNEIEQQTNIIWHYLDDIDEVLTDIK